MSTSNDTPLDALRRDRGRLLDELRAAGATVREGNAIRCPWSSEHRQGDKNPSGGVWADDAGVFRYKCHGCGWCGDAADVMARASGREVPDVLRELTAVPRPKPPTRTYADVDAVRRSVTGLEHLYSYTNPATRAAELLVARVRRPEGGKRFLQFRAAECGRGFESGAPPKPWPIYNRRRVAAADEVVVVEGEKAVHALHDVGVVATTSPAGAGKARHADWSPLAGKVVYLWPDHDEPGMKHMDEVAEALARLDPKPTVWRVDPATLNLPTKGDAADFVVDATEGSPTDAVMAVLDNATPPTAPSDGLRVLLDDMAAGRRKNVPFGEFGTLTRLGKALLPGTVTLVWGNPGDGKSFLMVEALRAWATSGLPVAYFELEEDKDFHLLWALVQLEGDIRFLDDDYIRANHEAVMAAYGFHRPLLDQLANSIWSAPDRVQTLDELGDWVDERAAEGRRVIIVDPVSAADAGREPWTADRNFVLRCKVAARRHRCSVVLVSHPTKGGTTRKGPARGEMSEMAGGSAYGRHTQTILFVRKETDASRVLVSQMTRIGDGFQTRQMTVSANQAIRITKCRNGVGCDAEIAFRFDPATGIFTEQGLVVGPKAWNRGATEDHEVDVTQDI